MNDYISQAHVKSHLRAVRPSGHSPSTVSGWIDNNMVYKGETGTVCKPKY